MPIYFFFVAQQAEELKASQTTTKDFLNYRKIAAEQQH